MIKILKASAGSGKTFRLAEEYIALLIGSDDPYAYRHMLAVTFTNKATDEMKQRILKELDTLANSSESSKYLTDLKERTGKGLAAISSSARRLLCNILNDYGAFSVSTIDKFFQRTLKAFSREIGQFASYQVELDKKSLVNESVDRILDALTEDNRQLLDWLTDSVKEQLLASGRFSLEKELYDMAWSLKSEDHREAVEHYGVDEDGMYTKEGLSALKKGCGKVISEYIEDVSGTAREILEALGRAGIYPEDFTRQFLKQLNSYPELKPGSRVKRPTDAFLKNAADPEKWFPKKNASLLPEAERLISGPLARFCSLFGDPYRVYMTAVLINSQIYSLGLVREVNNSFNELMKEKNVLSLDDSNTILKGIIGGSDTPFIYEKIGVRFEHFLLDEFQDTSNIQWDNFHPLLADSDAAGNDNLIVGDVKQSIYRWRNSDWNLLNSELKKQFPRAVEEPLNSNWRSLGSIVEFNDGFYLYAAGCLDAVSGTDEITAIYKDVRQEVRSADKACGNVDVIFCESSDEENAQMNAVLDEVRRLRGCGAAYSDIGILVRTNVTGAETASALLDAGIPVISDDSLNVKASPAVRRLVALLSYVNNPEDKLNSFLASSLEITPPSGFNSLSDLCEYFIREMKSGLKTEFSGEVPYIQAFMDTVQDWTGINGNSLSDFLSYWDTADPKISSPDDADAVRIMTIHKSKGLAFPYVIFPYSESVKLYRPDSRWCHPDAEGTPLENLATGVYLVNLSSSSDQTLFAADYRKEKLMQMVDGINAYYVATTRAEKGMTIISAMPSDQCRKNVGEGASYGFSDMSQILYWYTHLPSSGGIFREMAPYDAEDEETEGRKYCSERFRKGEPYVFSGNVKVSEGTESDSYPSYPLNPPAESGKSAGGRLKFSSESSDFFSPEGKTGIDSSERLRGIVLHDILSNVIVPDDLAGAVKDSFESGNMDARERDAVNSMLSERISSARRLGWFPDDPKGVFTEIPVVDTDGEVYRPDRVLVRDGKVTIVDYKFGLPEKKHVSQVRKYAEMYRAMGYSDVTASLWYVPEDKVVPVC